MQLTCVYPNDGSKSEQCVVVVLPHGRHRLSAPRAPRITGVPARGFFGVHACAAVFFVVVAVVMVVVGGACNMGVV